MIPEAAARLSRRSVMAAAVAAVGTGCSTRPADTSPGATAGGTAGGTGKGGALPPEAAVRARALADSRELIGRYDAASAAHPSLAARLRPLRAEVARHIEAFGGTAPAASPAAPSPAASSGASSGTAAQALSALASAERALADRRAAALLTAPAEQARLLASVAAAGAGHAALLGAKASGKSTAAQDGNHSSGQDEDQGGSGS
jgi:hypothetical protein